MVNSAGAQTGVLAQWPGAAGTPVRTTINPTVQHAALTALDSVSSSGEIVAVQASTGGVLAVAQHQASGALPAGGPLNAKLMPGTAFTVVSAAALFSNDLATASTSVSCANSFNVGGQTFTSDGTGEQKPFTDDFAEGCNTAFASLSERLTAGMWAQMIKEFGIGSNWSQLPVPAFSGSVPPRGGRCRPRRSDHRPRGRADELAVHGHGGRGGGRRPLLRPAGDPDADPASTPGTTMDLGMVSALHELMRGAVRSGAARAANVRGGQVYGQVGLVHTESGWMSWFVGYRGDIAIAAIESGKTAQLSAAALTGAFFSAVR